ncbi:MAG: hypothetical protein ACXWM8_07060, partial [Candidatus Limnocylindrales bacterium]
MRNFSVRLAAIVVLGLVLAGCTGAGASTWTFSPAGSPAAPANAASGSPAAASSMPMDMGAVSSSSIAVEAFDLGFK